MAESEIDNAQERTEQATPRRLEQAREKGEIPRSRELTTMLLLLAGAAALLAGGARLGGSMEALFRGSMQVPRERLFDAGQMYLMFRDAALDALIAVLPVLLLLAAVALLAPLALGGFILNFGLLGARLDRLNPITGLQRVFGPQGLVEMLKSVAKFLVIGAVALWMLHAQFGVVLALGHGALEQGVYDALWLVGRTFLVVAAATVVIAGVDVPWQLWQHARKLRMSKQQIREELKDTDGKPEVRSRIRQLQQEIASRRMMEEVPKADVVITNPTHYAVALRYDSRRMGAPRVVARGADLLAARIRDLAQQHRVPLLSAPPLARALYHSTRLNQEIPRGLYLAVAQVLAYVVQLKQGAAVRPPADLPVPPDLAR